MMTSLLIIMIILAVNSFFMDGAKEGLAFYLIPDFERMKQIGIAKTITGAMNRIFHVKPWNRAMAIWGSYIGKERSLLGESVNIAILDTFVAITSGLIIFPACFTFHVDQTSGPSLILSPCRIFLTIFRLADSGEACSFCLCFLQRFPQSWQYLKTSSPAVWN